jgi:hypothetical protein
VRIQSKEQTATIPSLFTTRDILERTSITRRQVQWWDEHGVVVAKRRAVYSGLAPQRLYSYPQVIKLLIVVQLRRKHWGLARISAAPRFVAKCLTQVRKHPERNFRLITVGTSMSLESDNNRIINILKSARAGVSLISVTDQMRLLDRGLRVARVPASKCERGKAASAGR